MDDQNQELKSRNVNVANGGSCSASSCPCASIGKCTIKPRFNIACSAMALKFWRPDFDRCLPIPLIKAIMCARAKIHQGLGQHAIAQDGIEWIAQNSDEATVTRGQRLTVER